MSDPPKITKDEKTKGASKMKYSRRREAKERKARDRRAAAVKNYHEVANLFALLTT